jgi:hypothetical protein
MISNSRFNGLTKQHSSGKPLKRLKIVWLVAVTGLKTGVNESKNSVNPLNRFREHCGFGSYLTPAGRHYLENG